MKPSNLNIKQERNRQPRPKCFFHGAETSRAGLVDSPGPPAEAYPAKTGRRFIREWAGPALIMILVLGLLGCSSKPKVVQPQLPITADPGAPQWTYGSNAIRLQLRADQRLNLYDDQAHTLAVCLYQFTDPNNFNDLSKDQAGLLKLLKCEKSGADVAGVQRVIMQPGESRDLHLDRAEGAKFVGVVAGYYDLKAEKAALLLEIPIVVFKKGFIFTTKYQVPGQLDVQLNLGPTTISEVGKK
jgi:type VI secretion system VasD/TssJ family lipoprotein